MNCLWKIVRNIMAAIGFIFILGVAGTADHASYYGTAETEGLITWLIVGLILMVPAIINLIYEFIKGYIL